MLGIENLKKAVKFGIDLGEQFDKALADNKFQWTDSFGFFDELIQVPGLIKDGKVIVAELKDLDTVEKDELIVFIQEEFDIENDKAEAEIEAALKTVAGILELINLIRQR